MSDEQDSMLDAAGDFVGSGVDAVADAGSALDHEFRALGDAFEAGGDRIGAAVGELVDRSDVRDYWEQQARDDMADFAFQDLQGHRAFEDAGEHLWGSDAPMETPVAPQDDEMMQSDQAEPEPEYTPDFDPNVPATGGV